MFLLPHREIIIFDLEYTDSAISDAAGLLPDIVEIGALKVNSELEVEDKFESLVRPSNLDLYTDFCFNLTGIKRRDLQNAKYFQDVWKDFASFTEYAKWPLMSWGVESDVPILRMSYLKRRMGFPHSNIAIDAKSIVWAFAGMSGLKIGGYSLRGVCKYFGIETERRHRALYDAELILKILKEIDKEVDGEEFKLIEV